MKKFPPTFPDFPHMLHGGDYNPEQWRETPEIWDEDMRLMKLAHTNEMTMGIFSWAEIEPQEGVFDFSVLDTLMDKIHQNGGRVILATPSGARPHWLADKYPEVLRVNVEGHKERFSRRHNHCITSPAYRRRVAIIDEKLAERYANHPALLGWHLSNEYGGYCYCDLCTKKFQKWLEEKYGTIEELNRRWWTRFWSHRYDSFSQIEPPAPGIGEAFVQGLHLDWKRFTSDNTIDFIKEEIKAVRKFSQKPVTTNCMGFNPEIDHRELEKHLDFFSQDEYPFWANGTQVTAERYAVLLDYCRGIKHGQPFLMMESAPGIHVSAMAFKKTKTDGQQLLEAVKMISHGSDSVMYFQWRKGRGAHEKFHGAVVDHYGKPDTRVFQNVSKVGQTLEKMDKIVGSAVKSDVAITFDNQTRWALNGSADIGDWTDNGYTDTAFAFHRAFYRRNIPVDMVGYDVDFNKYKVVVLTTPYMMEQPLADKIKAYVENGGTIISTYLTAVVDSTDLCHLGGTPALGLSEVFGLRVDEIDTYRQFDKITATNSVAFGGKEYDLYSIAEHVVAHSAKALARYTAPDFTSDGALFQNSFGKGTAYYMAFQHNTFQEALADHVIAQCGLTPPMAVQAEDGIILRKREGDGESFYFITNETDETKSVVLDKPYRNLLTGESVSGKQTLPSCGFLVLTDE